MNGKDSLLRLPNTKMSHMHPHGISNNPAESIEWQHVEIGSLGKSSPKGTLFRVMMKMKIIRGVLHVVVVVIVVTVVNVVTVLTVLTVVVCRRRQNLASHSET